MAVFSVIVKVSQCSVKERLKNEDINRSHSRRGEEGEGRGGGDRHTFQRLEFQLALTPAIGRHTFKNVYFRDGICRNTLIKI